jgi:tetratricopeptide (TPR) repeat protein
MVKGLPLLLRLAASSISRHHITTAHYIENWKKRGSSSELLGSSETHLRSFELAFEELLRQNPLTLKLLMLFSFLDYKDIWFELCLNFHESNHPQWLRHLLNERDITEHMNLLADFSFVEVKPHRDRKYLYEIHPAIHAFARCKAADDEEEYLKCAVSLVTAMVPRSIDKNSRETAQRLEPHALQCLIHMQHGKWGCESELTTLAKLANLFRLTGRHSEAQKHYEMVLGALKATSPSASSVQFTVDICDNLGLVYYAQGHYARALSAFDFSMERRQRDSEEDLAASMGTLYNAGLSLLMLGDLPKARVRFMVAAEYFSKAGPDSGLEDSQAKHLYYRVLNDLGEIYLRQDLLEEAKSTLTEAAYGLKQYLKAPHPHLLAVKLNYAKVYIKEKRFEEARIYIEDVIAVYQDWWGEQHAETMRAMFELADLLMQHGKLSIMMNNSEEAGAIELLKSEQLLKKALVFYQKLYGTHCDMVVVIEEKLACLRLPPLSDNPFDASYHVSARS